jgi:hypothetical protein
MDFDLKPMQTAGLWSNIKNSSLYKLLDDPKVMGIELGHEGILEALNLLQNSGLLKKVVRLNKIWHTNPMNDWFVKFLIVKIIDM